MCRIRERGGLLETRRTAMATGESGPRLGRARGPVGPFPGHRAGTPRWSRLSGQVVEADPIAGAAVHVGVEGAGAAREAESVQAIAACFELHADRVSPWKRQAVEGRGEVLSGSSGARRAEAHDAKIRDRHARPGSRRSGRIFSARRGRSSEASGRGDAGPRSHDSPPAGDSLALGLELRVTDVGDCHQVPLTVLV